MLSRRGFNVWRAHRSALGFRALVMVAALFACGGSGSDSTGPSTPGAISISITPSAPSVNVGAQLALQATVKDGNGNPVSGANIFWSSADTSIVTVSASGLITGKAVGATQVAASSEGQSAKATVTVSPVPVSSVAVLPSSATLVIGGTVPLQAVAYDAGGNGLSGRDVAWASSAPQVATVDGSGKVTGVTAGAATISATCEGKTASSAITVTVVAVAAVVVAPGSASLTVGQSTSFSATATDSHGNVLAGRPVAWSSANSAVATVTTAGLVSGVGAGTTTITATIEGKSDGAQVVVTGSPPPVPVASVVVNPGTASLNIGGTVTISATVRDANGAALSGRTVTWSTSASGIATVSSAGLVTAVAPGSASITATSEGKSGSATITVQPVAPNPVASVTVLPTNLSLVVDSTTTIVATMRDGAGNVLSGRAVTWISNDAGIATVSSTTGLVTAIAPGNAAITATSEGKSAAAVVVVSPAPVATITVNPTTVSILQGATTILVDTTRDAHGKILTGRSVTWTSDTPAAATVTSSGVVSALATGAATSTVVTITATSEGKSASATVTVNPIPVATVTVSPNAASIVAGDNVTLTATAKDAGGNVLAGRTITWTSGTPATGTVSATGVVTGVAAGTTVITASSGGKTGTSTITVTAVPVAFVSIAPASATLIQGNTQLLTATPEDAAHHALTGRAAPAWSSDAPGVASVDPGTGVVTAVSPGTANISALIEGTTGTASITVNPIPVDSVSVSPTSATIAVNGTVTLTAQPLDAAHNPLNGRTITWAADASGNATVTPTSATTADVTGVIAGSATITVTCEGKTTTVTITVTP